MIYDLPNWRRMIRVQASSSTMAPIALHRSSRSSSLPSSPPQSESTIEPDSTVDTCSASFENVSRDLGDSLLNESALFVLILPLATVDNFAFFFRKTCALFFNWIFDRLGRCRDNRLGRCSGLGSLLFNWLFWRYSGRQLWPERRWRSRLGNLPELYTRLEVLGVNCRFSTQHDGNVDGKNKLGEWSSSHGVLAICFVDFLLCVQCLYDDIIESFNCDRLKVQAEEVIIFVVLYLRWALESE